MYKYIVATTCFSLKNFSQIIYHALNTVFISRCQKFKIYSANAIMMAKVFKYLPKSEPAIHTRSLKKLFQSISHNSCENTCSGVFFYLCVDYIFSLFQAYNPVLRLLLFRADQHFLFYFTLCSFRRSY